MGYTGTSWGHKSRDLQAAAGLGQGEVTQGSAWLCCSPSCVWLCCIVFGSPPAYSRAHSAPTPAVQKSAQSVPRDAAGVQVQHTKHLFFPLDTALLSHSHGVGRSAGEELGLASSWGDGNTGKCCWERQRSAWCGLFRLLLLPLHICS